MTLHDPSSPRKPRANSGQKIAFKGDHPAHLYGLSPGKWDHDSEGRPLWIVRIPEAERLPWARILVRPAQSLEQPSENAEALLVEEFAPAAMPLALELAPLLYGEGRRPKGRGRARTEDAATRTSLAAAWAGDMRDVSTWELGRRLSPPSADRYNARRYAKRRLDAGRRILYWLGVLPWVAWQDGALPPGWWTTGTFARALRGWYHVHTAILNRHQAGLPV
jgi:hypothetical protein